ncbi:hypothetical protein CTAYLR_000559 [Chrysophaeum taylorii]|uniref:Phosphoglycerate mutase n=1 Tax=Chrysophaeum taylorii TaxID=2483200 RepID=A0AAD7XND3_9STRA|nr:hypothetical protein CTAYLR_000559 [Chrysophaeum taylorii]
MNVALARQPWGSPGFKDPEIRDSGLTACGVAAAQRIEAPPVDLVVASPLTRALQTAAAAYPQGGIALPLAAERVYLSSDLGTPRSELQQKWPQFDFVGDENWWYEADGPEWRPPGTYVCPGEPKDAFVDRMDRLLTWLRARPEKKIALVSHWGVIASLTGRDFDNCELQTLRLDALRVRNPIY